MRLRSVLLGLGLVALVSGCGEDEQAKLDRLRWRKWQEHSLELQNQAVEQQRRVLHELRNDHRRRRSSLPPLPSLELPELPRPGDSLRIPQHAPRLPSALPRPRPTKSGPSLFTRGKSTLWGAVDSEIGLGLLFFGVIVAVAVGITKVIFWPAYSQENSKTEGPGTPHHPTQ